MQVTIPNGLICAANPHESTRYSIAGVYVNPAGVAAATDGHMLAVRLCAVEGGDGPSIIPASVVDDSNFGTSCEYHYDDGEWRNLTRGRYDDPVDGEFPPYTKVIPECYPDDECVTIAIDARRLARLAEALGYKRVMLRIRSPEKPVLVLPLNGENALGVLVPVKDAEQGAWFSDKWESIRRAVLEAEGKTKPDEEATECK